MQKNYVIGFGAPLLLLVAFANHGVAVDEIPIKEHVYVQAAGGGNLVVEKGIIRFRKGMRGLTLWNVEFRKDGFRIVQAKTGKILGIDEKKRELVFFDKPGLTTTWQFMSSGNPPNPKDAFEVLLFMKVGEEELRLSTGDAGTPILGGKATLISFDYWSP